MHNTIYFSNSFDPYHNLALEELLFDAQGEGCTLYLWQNQNTVVIGKNQNAWKECRLSLLEQEGGKLARRTSGGGAVFHDTGNLNFTFLLPRAEYDVHRQLSVIQRAAAKFKIQAEFTGRNDLVEASTGAKFSGNAFRRTEKTAMHHGTVLVDVDMQKLARYLAPAQDKLAAKGVESVRARVKNLRALCPELTVKQMQDALVDAFIAVYGPARLGQVGELNQAALISATSRHASWEWRLGRTPKFDITMERRFDWGGLELSLSLREGHVQDVAVFSDSMEEAFIERIGPALLGAAFRSAELSERLLDLGHAQADEIAAWILEKGF